MSGRERTATAAVGLLLASVVGIAAHYRPPGSLYSLGVTTFSPYLRLAAVPAAIVFLRLARPLGRAGAAACLVPIGWLVVLQGPTFVAQTAPPGVDVMAICILEATRLPTASSTCTYALILVSGVFSS